MFYFVFISFFLILFAWTCFFYIYFKQKRVKDKLYSIASNLQIELSKDGSESLVELINKILELSNKRLNLITPELVENRIKSREELSHSLEKIVNKTHALIKAQSVELALYDSENNLFHTALLVGKPFAHDLQAMLSTDEKPESELEKLGIVIQNITFSNTTLGSIRIAVADQQKLTKSDKEIIRFLALQAALAIMNAQYADELLKLQKNSEAGLKARTGFLANLSHEIRGPLGIILNAVELVIEGLCGELNQDQKETLSMVKNNGEHLLELVNDVLDYAKVESGNLLPKPISVNAEELIQDLTDVVRTQALKKKQVIEFVKNNEALNIYADKRHLRQMLINILTNAVKYTKDEGQIKIWMTTSDNFITIHVLDNGIGIEDNQKDKVFSVFERVEDAYATEQLGTGLGMPLTKRLAELNNGTIDFDSVYGQGSTFRLRLPMANISNQVLVTESSKILKGIANSENIIYIEKNRDESSVIRRYLEHFGFNVLVHDQNVNIQDYNIKDDTRILLMDASILKAHPIDFLNKIKDQFPSLAILILTSKALDFEIESYLKNGADICISKPINLTELAQSCLDLSKL
jgi:signal transduction histidine kinase